MLPAVHAHPARNTHTCVNGHTSDRNASVKPELPVKPYNLPLRAEGLRQTLLVAYNAAWSRALAEAGHLMNTTASVIISLQVWRL